MRDPVSIAWSSDAPISQNRRQTPYSFGYPHWLQSDFKWWSHTLSATRYCADASTMLVMPGGTQVFKCFNVFTSYQYLRSWQDGYRLVTVATHGDLTVLPQLETRPPAPWPDIPLRQIILTLSQPVLVLLYPNNAVCLARKRQVSMLKSLVCLNESSNPWGLNFPISQKGDGRSTHSVIPSGHIRMSTVL